MQRAFRSFLVGVMIALMSFDPATACHFLRGGWGGGYGGGYCGYGGYYGSSCGSCYSYSTPVYYGGYSSCSSCGYSTVVYDSSCDGCSSGCSDCGNSGCSGCDSGCSDCVSGCSDCGSNVSEGTLIEGAVIESGPTMMNEQPAMEQMAPAPPTDMRPAMPSRPAPTPMPSTVNRPAETMPAPSMPADAKPPVVPPQTVETPPAAVTPPPATPATPPASNDLFGAPAEEPAKPAAESTDSLFGPTTPEAPATPPAAAPSTAPATPPSEPNNDLFGPASTDSSAPVTPPQDSTMPPAATEPPADGTTPPAEEKKTDADNLFGGLEQILREPGGLASEEMRLWVDSTGQFTCRGRLVRFLDGQVRLMKDNGRTTTVALYRLSQNDLEFINRQASAQRSEGIERTAQVDVTPAVAAN